MGIKFSNILKRNAMGFFDRFKSGNNSERVLSSETLLNLMTTSNSIFERNRKNYEKAFLPMDLISDDTPIEYQVENVKDYEEFKNRYTISSGIVSLSIIEYLIRKKVGNNQNLKTLESVKAQVFPNFLRIRAAINSNSGKGYSELSNILYDNEGTIANNTQSLNKFLQTITILSDDVKAFIESSSDLIKVRSYYGARIGQIFPEFLADKNKSGERLIKDTVSSVVQSLEVGYFNKL